MTAVMDRTDTDKVGFPKGKLKKVDAKSATTLLHFVLDRSGSMSPVVDDVIGGFNQLLVDQRKVKGGMDVSLTIFDNEVTPIYARQPLKKVSNLDRTTYAVRGSTALLDAVGQTLENLLSDEQSKYDKVVMVVYTDGAENASKKFKLDRIRELVKGAEDNGWQFIFLGANMDAWSEASAMGSRNVAFTSASYVNDSAGITRTYTGLNSALSAYCVDNSSNAVMDVASELNKVA